MSYSNAWKESDGDFLLTISGSTHSARFLTGWQEFKDYIRNFVKEQPGWVDAYPSQTQRRGEMQGWARLRDREDAEAAYRIYSRSEGILAHLWETCRSSEGFRRLRCNCHSLFPEIPEGFHLAEQCGIDLERFSHLTGGTRATYSIVVPQHFPTYEYAYPTSQSYNVPAMYPSYAPPALVPVYSTNVYGIPVNIQNGAVLAEARDIFIKNLSYKCTLSDLYSLILTVGHPVDYKLLRDHRTGSFKGLATATFGSQDHAQRAASTLNRVEHMGMTLKVGIEKDMTAAGQAAPLIVGSDMYSV